MASKRNETVVDRAAQLRVLASPVRIAIHMVVINHGEVSVKEIGEQLGRSVPTLYRHLEEMERVGLIRATGTRETRTRKAKLYSAVNGKQFKLMRSLDNEECVEALGNVAKSQMRHAAREFSDALEAGDAATTGKRRSTHFFTHRGWLTGKQLEELNGHIAAIENLYNDSKRGEGRSHVATTIAMRPSSVGEA